MRLPAPAVRVWADLQRNFDALGKTLVSTVTIKKQNVGAANQSGPANGVYWPYNIANAPFLDLTPGIWHVTGAAFMVGNVSDYVVLGLYDETAAAGVNFSAGATSFVPTVTPISVFVDHIFTVTGNHRYRLWVIPNGASTQTIVGTGGLAISTAYMIAEKLIS